MRTFVLAVTCLAAALDAFPVYAAEAATGDMRTSPIVRELLDMRSPRSAEAGLNFVAGNDLWQPGQQFRGGSDWLALACNAEVCSLVPAELGVKPELWQGHYDDEPTRGQHLTFTTGDATAGEIVAWISMESAPKWLRPGTVTTYYSPQRPLKQPSGQGTLEAMIELPNGRSARLIPLLATRQFLERIQPQGQYYGPEVVLQLRMQNKRQLLGGRLGTCSGVFHPRRYLLWSGDLDLDGKPDFLVSFVDADGPVHLYLSSAAKPDRLVGLAGVYNSPPFGGECDGPGGFMLSGNTNDE